MADVFLDLWGVLTDSRKMTPAYRQRAAEILWSRHRGFVSTNATEANARGALRGATLLDEVYGLFTGEVMNAGKTDAAYWRWVVDRLKVEAKRSFVVDDRPEYLKAAAFVGFRCLLMDRDARHPLPTTPPFVEASLRNLAGLPQYVADAVRAARVRA